MRQDPLILKGTKITCPQCHKHMLTAKVDVSRGMRINSGCMGFTENFPKPAPMWCPECGKDGAFFHCGYVHTEHGWVPERSTDGTE